MKQFNSLLGSCVNLDGDASALKNAVRDAMPDVEMIPKMEKRRRPSRKSRDRFVP